MHLPLPPTRHRLDVDWWAWTPEWNIQNLQYPCPGSITETAHVNCCSASRGLWLSLREEESSFTIGHVLSRWKCQWGALTLKTGVSEEGGRTRSEDPKGEKQRKCPACNLDFKCPRDTYPRAVIPNLGRFSSGPLKARLSWISQPPKLLFRTFIIPETVLWRWTTKSFTRRWR